MALVGSIVYEVLHKEETEPWLLGSKDERTVYLQRVLKAQGKCCHPVMPNVRMHIRCQMSIRMTY